MEDGNETSRDGETADEETSPADEAGPTDEVGPGEQRGASDGTGGDDAMGDDRRIYHRKVTPDAEEANQSLLRLLANIEQCEVTDLPPLYEKVDHLVENLFTEPPPADAQAELQFSYYGYRIELDQTGNVSFMKLADESPVDSEE